jgi:hypothetical protein
MLECPPFSPTMSSADAYVYLCMTFAMDEVGTQWDLREWWRTEAERRRSYGLSPEQEAGLAEHYRTLIWQLPEGGPRAPRVDPKQPFKQKRRYAIS